MKFVTTVHVARNEQSLSKKLFIYKIFLTSILETLQVYSEKAFFKNISMNEEFLRHTYFYRCYTNKQTQSSISTPGSTSGESRNSHRREDSTRHTIIFVMFCELSSLRNFMLIR